MEIISLPFNGSMKRQWRRRGYNKLATANRKNMQVTRFGGNTKRSWRIRLGRKLRLIRLVSPLKLWYKLKNGYMNMMLKLVAKSGSSSGNMLCDKRIPKARDIVTDQSRTEFENRLVLEIYKSMVTSLELGHNRSS